MPFHSSRRMCVVVFAGLVDYLNNPTTYDGHGLSASKRRGSGLESAFAASCNLLLNRSQGHLGGSPIHQGRRHLAQDALHEAAGHRLLHNVHLQESRRFSDVLKNFFETAAVVFLSSCVPERTCPDLRIHHGPVALLSELLARKLSR